MNRQDDVMMKNILMNQQDDAMMKGFSRFIAEQAQRLCEKLKFPTKRQELTIEERTPDEIVETLLFFLKDGEVKELEDIAHAVRIPEYKAGRILEGMVREKFAKRGYKLTEKTIEFAKIIEDIQSLPGPGE